jgi:hypothetical protein
MDGARRIVAGLEAAGVTLGASVPDTWIGKLMAEVRRSPRVRAVDVAREEEAVAVACGANLAGGARRAVPHTVLRPLALSMALTRPDRRVVALEGDGSLLMSPNVLATVSAARPGNLAILLWVNRHYESSGGQALPEAPVDWNGLGRAAGPPSLLVLDVAFDPTEQIPTYSERPEEIRARFASRMSGGRS